MGDHLFPMIEEKADKTALDRIERKIDQITAKVIDYDTRLKKIEPTPTYCFMN